MSLARTTEFFRIKINVIELSTGKILENLLQSAFQKLGDKFNFQLDNNLKHKAKYPGVDYQDNTECS